MTVTTRPATPLRLPAPPPSRRQRGREVRTGLLGVLGLLAVVVGVPVALALSVGNPLPTTLPSREWLVADVSATSVIRVLAAVLWLAWAHFAVCLLTEWRAARGGRGLPGEVPLGGGSQLVARRLVAAALLLAGAATLTPAPSTGAPARPAAVISQVETPVVQAAAETGAPAVAQADAAPKTYTVQPPDGRRYDSLWDIAERTLGDPFRYNEVFELNRDRQQDDGRVLVDANLIHPGWVLHMPADASGPGVSTPALTPPAAPAGGPVSTPEQDPVQQAPASPGALSSAVGTSGAEVRSAPADGRGWLGGGLLAAGLLIALSARRGPYGRPDEAVVEQQVRLAASPGRVDLLDRGLRVLAAECAGADRPLPEVVAAYCTDDELVLSVVGAPDAPPLPWRAVSDGRGWALSTADLGDRATPDVAAPYPALAGIGLHAGADVLVDLEAAPGLVALTGDGLVAREVASALLLELATNGWSDGVRVTAVGFGDDLAQAAPHAITAADLLDDVLTELEHEARTAQDALRAVGVDGVLSGRLLRAAGRTRPRVVVLSGPPTPQEAVRLQALVSTGRTPLAVVCVGEAEGARWRFVLEADGTIDLGVLGVRAQARRLTRDGYLPLLDLLLRADHERLEQAATVGALTPGAALADAASGPGTPGTGTPGTGTPGPAMPAAVRGVAAVQVQLLGPVSVQAARDVEPAVRPLLTEIVVAVALHPDGLHEAALRAMVWPRGAGDDVLAGTLAQAQEWLGTGRDGRPRLRRADGGRWVLAGDVHTDVDTLRAAAAAGEGPKQETALRGVLDNVRGEAFSAVPAGRYCWLAFHAAARDARVVGTAVARRAASLALARGDRAAAEQALRTGLHLVPAAEPLWRDLLRLVGPGAPAETVAAEAYAALDRRGLPAEAETDALVQQLAPDVRRRA